MPSIDSVISRSADLAPDQPAIREWDSGREVSYADFDARVSISYLDSASHRHPEYRSSAGRPFLAAEIRIRAAGDDGVGEIEVKAPWQPKARLAEAGRQVITDDWTPTGDLGELKDGFIFLRDRKNDVIISGGFNVYPLEVEAAIESYPGVGGVAVVSAPDDRWGEWVVAFVVPPESDRFDAEALREHCQQRLARYKVPKEFREVVEISLNANGKPDRRRLTTAALGIYRRLRRALVRKGSLGRIRRQGIRMQWGEKDTAPFPIHEH